MLTNAQHNKVLRIMQITHKRMSADRRTFKLFEEAIEIMEKGKTDKHNLPQEFVEDFTDEWDKARLAVLTGINKRGN